MQQHRAKNAFIRIVCCLLVLIMLPLSALADKTGKVTASALNMRASASTDSKCVKTLHEGDKVTITGSKGSWYKVTVGKKTGYVAKKYVSVGGSSSNSSSSGNSSGSSSVNAKIKDLGSAPASSKPGDSGAKVKKLQKALKIRGYYSGEIDGNYGESTKKAVKKFQKSVGISADGVAGKKTIQKLFSTSSSSSGEKLTTERLDWFKNGSSTIPKRVTFTVKDCKTGKTFKVRRWSGANHIDAEPATYQDAQTMKSIFGGFSWKRRAILVKYNGHVYAASMNGMPHGTQTITDNGFEGHFCIHFYGSKTHGTKRVDKTHQNCVETAMKYTW